VAVYAKLDVPACVGSATSMDLHEANAPQHCALGLSFQVDESGGVIP
jgi:hypothetical protein